MRPATADPDRQPLHAATSSDRIQAESAAQFRGVRHDVSAGDHSELWLSQSGIELQYPARLAWPSPWVGHIPFAMWLVDALRPRVFVELGVHSGNSYCAFLQAVQYLALPSQCYGIDHWRGDQHADTYTEDVYTELRSYHDETYGTFSTLLRSTFEDARAYFSDGTVDLLHIDGFHSFEAVSSDLAEWLPKMSARGVVLLHDINVREREFGVWRVWEQLTTRYETFSFAHSHGLGVAYVGSEPPPPALRTLLTLKDVDSISRARTYFARLGASLVDRFERRQAESRADPVPAVKAALEAELNASRAEIARLTTSVGTLQEELAAARADTARHVEIVAAAQRERVALRAEAARRVAEIDRLRREIAALRTEIDRHGESAAAAEQALDLARAAVARHSETAAALQRELDAARAETSRQLEAIDTARASVDAGSQELAALGEELERTRRQVSAALAERERATLLLRDQMATTATLRREIALLRGKA